MKLIYRYMLAFFGVIVVALAIVSFSFIQYTSRMVYNNTWTQLEGYADILQKRAFSTAKVSGGEPAITYEFIQNSEDILSKQNVHFSFFNAKNQQIYPQTDANTNLPAASWKKLKKGQVLRLPMLQRSRERNAADRKPQTVILKPVFYNNKLLFVILVGANVENVQANIQQIEHNLVIALIISVIVAIILSYILARYQTRRIDKLRSAAHQVAQGDFDVAVPQKEGGDEIDDLAADFNEMTQSLGDQRDEIKRQEERRKQFMADAAHEMRTPLTTINGLLEGLAYDAIPEDMRGKSIELMRNETNRLIRLVNENLDYEKIRTNQIPLHEKTFNATEAVRNIFCTAEE
ncbi:HAMP domain protein [Lactobacillus selangorensis]|uniref:histidine kinase n=1 Tax=Lactobacillus selangorensis TaxID=81857 RepID=A0A0R2FWF7_9LACO|nr:HAMP domain protein [Lactobacillus selangorensis]KRN29790.1 HAMP domain protein [Lactobacillus selangorensis]